MLDLSLDNRVFILNSFDAALQELDMLFNTECMELIGYPDYGVNFEQYLWTLTPTTAELTEYINDKIKSTIYAKELKHSINVDFKQGEIRSIYVISISLNNPITKKVYTKKYQFQ